MEFYRKLSVHLNYKLIVKWHAHENNLINQRSTLTTSLITTLHNVPLRKLQEAGKSSSFSGFKDSSLSNSLTILDLIDSITPGHINYSLVNNKDSLSEEVRQLMLLLWRISVFITLLHFILLLKGHKTSHFTQSLSLQWPHSTWPCYYQYHLHTAFSLTMILKAANRQWNRQFSIF